VPPGNLDNGLLDGEVAAQEVDVTWPQYDEFPPPHPGLDEGLDHQSVTVGDGFDELAELIGGQRPTTPSDDLGQHRVLAKDS